MSLLSDGQVVRGCYEVERFLGEGAFAEVYRVKHRFMGRQAMKVFKMVGMTIEEIEEVLGEAAMLSPIGHPNIIRVFDADVTETSRGMCGFFTMEYVAGGTLEQFWRSHGSRYVSIGTSIEIARQVCRGLAVAHSETPPIIHRDIKPQNILVGYDSAGLRVRVTDFGLAKRVNPLTLLASARGTRAFKAPEVFLDPQGDSTAGDVWAIGSTLYLLLTDRLPFSDSQALDSFDSAALTRPLIPPSRLNAHADAFLDRVLARALSVDPRARYANASALLEDLDRWRPRPAQPATESKVQLFEDTTKYALGSAAISDGPPAASLAVEALKLSRQQGKLGEAADLMEEAFNKNPTLRNEYEYHVRLWRKGVVC
jgi:serine/threonine-protein kinase